MKLRQVAHRNLLRRIFSGRRLSFFVFFSFFVSAAVNIGCADTFQPGPDAKGRADGGDAGASCTSGQLRCYGYIRQRCENGAYVDAKICNAFCDGALGCVDCNPKGGRLCVGNEVHECTGQGTAGALVKKCVTEPCSSGACSGSNACPAGSTLIYVVDNEHNLRSFSPAKGANTFATVGQLKCPAGKPWFGWTSGPEPARPYSMSIDRGARAWVLYTSGEIFHVDTKTAACQPTSFLKGQQGFELFGMGFATEKAGSQKEELFVSGGQAGWRYDDKLGVVDTTLKLKVLGNSPAINTGAELTGAGNGKLFGYFPGDQSVIAELDKKSARALQKWTLAPLSNKTRSWAFAHWGGVFYLFVTTVASSGGATNSQVLRFDPKTGKTDTLLSKLPFEIVGAGVSTCAPVVQ